MHLPPLGSSSPGDLESVCSPKCLPPSEESTHKHRGVDVVLGKKLLPCVIIGAKTANINRGYSDINPYGLHADLLATVRVLPSNDAFKAKTERGEIRVMYIFIYIYTHTKILEPK